MSMSTKIIGFVSDTDETYKKQRKVLLACIEAGLNKLPPETAEYFGSEYPHENLLDDKLETKIPSHQWSADMQEGFEIIVSEIPKDIHKIRFYNSY